MAQPAGLALEPDAVDRNAQLLRSLALGEPGVSFVRLAHVFLSHMRSTRTRSVMASSAFCVAVHEPSCQ